MRCLHTLQQILASRQSLPHPTPTPVPTPMLIVHTAKKCELRACCNTCRHEVTGSRFCSTQISTVWRLSRDTVLVTVSADCTFPTPVACWRSGLVSGSICVAASKCGSWGCNLQSLQRVLTSTQGCKHLPTPLYPPSHPQQLNACCQSLVVHIAT